MSFLEKLTEIDHFQQSIEQHGKLGKDLLQKINYKFRLDWNYYSNRMEGNTLTLDETKSVMIGNINVHNKPFKYIMEMKGHDEAVMMILKMGKGELNISEKRIKDLHKEIMYEEFPGEKEKLGVWKSQANHVINYRDEKFDFVAPADVAENMHVLVNWVNAEKEKIAAKKDPLHPLELAFEFHLRYLTIHPFYDGNGRTGRILTNLILISYGFPPIYIKDSDKQFYYRYLADVQGYGADKYLFFDLMAGYLLRSLNIVLDAIAGKEIEEPEDLDKKIQLLQKELSGLQEHDPSKTYYSKAVLLKILDEWLSKLIVSAVQTAQKFAKFYSTNMHYASISNSGISVALDNANVNGQVDRLKSLMEDSNELSAFPKDFDITLYLEGLIGHSFDEPAKLNLSDFIKVRFLEDRYQLFVGIFEEKTNRVNSVKLYDRLLNEPVTTSEIMEITSQYGNSIFSNIEYKTRLYGLRK